MCQVPDDGDKGCSLCAGGQEYPGTLIKYGPKRVREKQLYTDLMTMQFVCTAFVVGFFG